MQSIPRAQKTRVRWRPISKAQGCGLILQIRECETLLGWTRVGGMSKRDEVCGPGYEMGRVESEAVLTS